MKSGDVSPFFSDPDEDELTYEVESSNADVAGVSIEGSSLTVTAVAAGTATVTVTASDPDGLSATQSAEVTVEEAGYSFRDDFDSEDSLDDWTLYNIDADVVDGILHLTETGDGFASADHVLETPVTEWTLRARMARDEASGFLILYSRTGHERFSTWRLAISNFDDGDNWRLGVYDEVESQWITFTGFFGNSSAIGEGAKEFTDIAFSHQNQELVLLAGDSELIRLETAGLRVRDVPFHDFIDNVTEVWLGAFGVTTLFDWVEFTGEEAGADIANGAGARRTLDLVRDAHRGLRRGSDPIGGQG